MLLNALISLDQLPRCTVKLIPPPQITYLSAPFTNVVFSWEGNIMPVVRSGTPQPDLGLCVWTTRRKLEGIPAA